MSKNNIETAMGTSLEGMTSIHTKFREAIHEMGNYLLHRYVRMRNHEHVQFFICSIHETDF